MFKSIAITTTADIMEEVEDAMMEELTSIMGEVILALVPLLLLDWEWRVYGPRWEEQMGWDA